MLHLQQWKKPLNFSETSRILSSLRFFVFAKPSLSAAKMVDDRDPPSSVQISNASVFRNRRRSEELRIKNFSQRGLLQDIFPDLLRIENPELALGFFFSVRNVYGFRRLRFSALAVAHVLASQCWFEELRLLVNQMVEDEGSGSAPSVCELLVNRFRNQDASSVVWDMLVFSYSRHEMVHEALFVLANMKDLKLLVLLQSYNCLLYNSRHTDMMWDVYGEIKFSKMTENEYTSSVLIDGLCKQSRLQDAIALLRNTEISSVSFNTVMSRLCKPGLLDEAKSLFCMMFKFGLLHDSYSYNIIVHGLCVAGSMDEALAFADDMEKHGFGRDLVTYNILAKGFHSLSIGETQKMLRHQMEASDFVTYFILINGLCKQGDIQRASRLYEEMRSKKIFPVNFAARAILLGLREKGNIGDARKFLDTLTTRDSINDTVLYNIMIDGYVKTGNMVEALQLYEKMIEKRTIPSIVTFNILIYGFCKFGTLDKARDLLDIIKKRDLAPNVTTYTTLMDGYCEKGNIEIVLELMAQMEAENIAPTRVTYTVVIKGLCKQWKLQETFQWIQIMYSNGLLPDQVTYNTVINYLCKAQKFTKAFQLLNDMLSHNLEPTPSTYNILINGLCVYGDLKDADNLLIFLEEQNVNLSKVAYTTVIKAHCAKGEVYRAIELFHRMVQKGFEVSIRDYSAVVNRLSKRFLLNEAKYFVNMMISDGIALDQELCKVMLNGFKQVGDMRSLSELLAKMIVSGFFQERV